MSRRNWMVAGLFAVLVALMLGAPSAASAAYTNPDCVSCHSTARGVVAAQNFGVGAVDFTTACKKCHDDSLAGTHPNHNPTSNCGSSCHPGWGASLVSAVPNYLDSRGYGAFAAANSADTDPAILHLIHSKPRWMESKEFSFSKCGSCHAVATCDSCHSNPPAPDDVTHTNHATSLSLSPWRGNTSSGVTNGDQTENTYVLNNANRCGAVGCHDTAGVASSAPGLLDDKSHTANAASGYLANVVTKTPTTAWRVMFSNVYTLGQISQSNTTSSTLSVPFTGEQFILVSDKDPYRGIAQILIDGVSHGTVDLYQDTTANQVEVFKSPILSSGPHTITVRVTGTKNPLARAAYVRVDQFKVYSNAPVDIAPACASCHADRTALHDPEAIGSFSHEASPSAGNLYSGYRCDSCHKMEFRGEHDRITSSTTSQLCASCHPTWAPSDQGISGDWVSTDGCNYRQCHVAASPREPHIGYAAAHAVTLDAAETSCRACHAGDLAVIHSNSVAGSFVTNCNTCHTPTKTATSKSCVDPACHVGTGVISVDTHAFNTTKHSAAPWTSAIQGASPVVATSGLECSVCHTARLDTAHNSTSLGAVSCSSGGTGNTGCHDNLSLIGRATATATWPTDKCTECHNSGTNVTHGTINSDHMVPAGTCAGTGSGCHAPTDLMTMHSQSQSGGAPKYSSCVNSGCHSSGNKDKRPALTTCGTGNSCHTAMTSDNHGAATAHVYTSASDYSQTTSETIAGESGCSDSGVACHGTVGTRDGVTEFHSTKTAGCTATDKCHGSSSMDATFKAAGSGTDCVRCHAGGFVNGTDATPLSGLSPAGHYGETTHTATGGLGNVTSGGTASAACSTCHSLSLKDAHGAARTGFSSATKGAYVTCQECHGYSVGMAAVVTGDWAGKACTACHTGTAGLAGLAHSTTAPVVNEVTTTCGSTTGLNCHVSTDLHALHKNASGGCDLSGCHDYTKQGFVPTAKSCGTGGACHTGYTKTTHTHTVGGGDAAKHQPTTTAQSTATQYGVACGSCHDIRTSGSSLTTEHALATSAKTGNANVCLNCHNNPLATSAILNSWSAKDTVIACSTCHTGALAIHGASVDTTHTKTNTGCASTGPGCHPTSILSQVGVPSTTANIHANCLRCHDRTGAATWTSAMLTTPGNLKYTPTATTCGAATGCHTSGFYNPAAGATQYYHRIGQANVVTGNDTKHTANAAYMASTENSGTALNVCSDCHIGTLASEHATTGPAATPTKIGCTSVTGPGYAGNTAGCHNTTTGAIAPNSAAMVKSSWNGGTKTCANCHTAKHNAIATSHTGTSTQNCGASGNGCHSTYDLAALHRNRAGGGGCRLSGCHDTATRSVRPSKKTCGSGNACHTAYTPTAGHRANTITGNETTHTATAASMTTKVDGTTYDTGGNNTCAACHSATLLTGHTTSANANTCAGCHNDTAPNSVTVIKTNSWSTQTCDECHVTNVNGGTAKHNTYTLATHTSTASGCTLTAGCHGWASGGQTLDVRAVHNRTFTNPGTTKGCTATGNDSKGTVPACHAINKAMSGALTCGDTGTCHAAHTGSNHGTVNHDIMTLAPANATTYAYHGVTYNLGNSIGCGNCHYMDLVKEHGTLASGGAGRTVEDGGSGCGVCHTDKGGTVGTSASRSAIVAAITSGVSTTGDMRCTTCHNGNLTTGTTAPHTSLTSNYQTEFSQTGANANGGGHNAMGTAWPLTTELGGRTVNTVPIQAAGWAFGFGQATFKVNARTGTTWAKGDAIYCSDCHVGDGTANGPQGAAVKYATYNGTTGAYSATKDTSWSQGSGNGYVLSSTTVAQAPGLCGKCHGALDSSGGHKSNHTGSSMKCTACHVRIPHGWKRPRLLRRTIGDTGAAGGTSGGIAADTIPYANDAVDLLPYPNVTGTPTTNGVKGLNVTADPQSGSGNCVTTGCKNHATASKLWP